MRRREFIGLAGAAGAAAIAPHLALAQPAPGPVPRGPGGRPWLIAALVNVTKVQSDIDSLPPFRKGMAALGYTEGRDYVIEARYADGDVTREPAMAKDLVQLSPDLILSTDGPGAIAAHDLTTTVPIIGYYGGNNAETIIPLLVGSTAKPNGNVTGIINDAATLIGKHCDLALEIVPTATRIGVLVNATGLDGGQRIREVAAAALAHKFTPALIDADRTDPAPAFRVLADERSDVIIVGPGFAIDRARTAQAAADVRIPTIYNEQGYVEAGGLISYGFSRVATFVRLASFADVLLRGARVANVPVEEVSTWIVAINLKTAKSLGLTIPPTVLFRADEVIE